jgi:hypothetical protein
MKRILGIGAVALLSVAALTACGSASGDDLTEDGKLDDFDYAYSAFQFSSKGSFDDTVEYANDSWDDLKKADREAAKFVKAEAYKTRSSDKSSRDEDDVLEHHDVIITGEDGFAVGQASVITTDALGDTCIVSAGFYTH